MIKSSFGSIVIAKFWLSLICFLAAAGFFASNLTQWGLLVPITLFLMGSFSSSLAIIQCLDKNLRYKRFLKWKPIALDEVVSSGALWPPFIGYIRFKQFVFPWGRLYFVLDTNTQANPFRRGEYPILRLLRGDTQLKADPEPPFRPTRLLIALGIGVILPLAASFLPLKPARPTFALHPQPGAAAIFDTTIRTLFHIAENPIFNFAVLILFCFSMIHRRRSADGWIFAFLAGIWATRLMQSLMVTLFG